MVHEKSALETQVLRPTGFVGDNTNKGGENLV